jgi:hypothetical protein
VRKEKGIVVPEKFLTGREERKRDSSTEEISHGERADHTQVLEPPEHARIDAPHEPMHDHREDQL